MLGKQITFHVTGIVPTIMHNGCLANSFHPVTKEIKKFTSRGVRKTENDMQVIAELEWIGSIYSDQKIEFSVDKEKDDRQLSVNCKGYPCWPGENIEAAICEAAKNNRKGKDFKISITCDGNFPLIIPGNPTVEDCFYDDQYFDTRLVVIKKNRIARTRPIFHEWGLSFTVSYLPEMINPQSIIDAVTHLGKKIGLSDNRPKFGRFNITEIKS